VEDQAMVLHLLTKRRQDLVAARTQTINRRKLAEGKSPKEALRCLKRRLSDAVYRCLLADRRCRAVTG
jgi:hypothetical protein